MSLLEKVRDKLQSYNGAPYTQETFYAMRGLCHGAVFEWCMTHGYDWLPQEALLTLVLEEISVQGRPLADILKSFETPLRPYL